LVDALAKGEHTGLFNRYSRVSGGAWHCPLFAIDVKRGGKRQEEEKDKKRVLPSMTKGEIVGTIFTGSIDLSLMASTIVKQTSESFKDSRTISLGGITFL
jgi:hypothetical protein